MTVVSYRFYCDGCSEEQVIREDKFDESPWKVNSIVQHSGTCPRCNEHVDLDDVDWSPEPETLDLEDLDHIGAKAAQNLREAGYDTTDAIADASDAELLDVSWVGDKGLQSLKGAAKQLEPQKRWNQ